MLAAGLAVTLGVGACSTRDVFLIPGRAAIVPPDSGTGVPEASADTGIRDAIVSDVDLGCAVDRYPVAPEPLGIYILVDQSSSMALVWPAVVQALTEFILVISQREKTSAGLEFFPNLDGEPIDALTVCQPSAYTAMDVPMSLLPGNASALVDSLGRHGPDVLAQQYTGLAAAQLLLVDGPVSAAVTGAIQAIRAWETVHAAEGGRGVLVLVTDTIPILSSPACLATLDLTIAAAAEGYSGFPSVLTYVLGVQSLATELNVVAEAGGTFAAHLAESTAAADIGRELGAVQGYGLPCEVTVDPQWLTSGLVNVDVLGQWGRRRLTRALGPEVCVPGASDARADASGAALDGSPIPLDGSAGSASWYAADPNRVVLCPAACAATRADGASALEVIYGCPTLR